MLAARLARSRNLVVLVAVVLVAWEVLPRLLRVPAYILPTFSRVYAVLDAKGAFLLRHTWPTLYEIAFGFVLAVLVGVVCGLAIGQFPVVRDTVYPLLIVVNSVPKVALAPLIIIWLGFGLPSILTIVVLLAFFPVLVNTMVGVTNVQPELIELVRTMTPSRTREFLRVRLPSSVPYIFAGMKTSITLASVGAVVAEFIVGQRGLGFVILSAQQSLDVAMIFACLTLLVVVTLGLFGVLVAAERVMMPWRRGTDIL
jgi:NitT/TauT family transport system permease protein